MTPFLLAVASYSRYVRLDKQVRKTMQKTYWVLPVLLAACTGTITGQVRGTGERVQISFEEQLDHVRYAAKVGNENFAGKAIQEGATSIFGTELGITSTNRVNAVMLGDKGSSLTCQMHYADSSGITAAGGVGVCQHSDGRIIDVVW